MRKAGRERTSTRNPRSPQKSSTAYTPQQRERMQRGLRILARMIVRAHLRREASQGGPAPPPDRWPGG